MIDLDRLLASRNDPAALAQVLEAGDVEALAALLPEKADDLRYAAFLVLQARSRLQPDVYPLWDRFTAMLGHENSYQRNIALRLLAENVRWDKGKKFHNVFPSWIEHCTDGKFVTCRQALQSIPAWAPFAPELAEQAAALLMAIDVSTFRESQQKLILTDILDALLSLRPSFSSEQVEAYFAAALNGTLLDKKTKKRLETALSQ